MRLIVLDTETTGLETSQGHRIIEIGAVEVINRKITGNNFHVYIQPHRDIDEGATSVHGITNDFLKDKPDFSDIAKDFIKYVDASELVIHNAAFDVGFLNYELGMLDDKELQTPIEKTCRVTDTLAMARDIYPGQRNNLDALCKRLGIENEHRVLHGALLDAEILADVYLVMTGGQINLISDNQNNENKQDPSKIVRLDNSKLHRILPSEKELALHQEYFAAIKND